MVYQHLVGIRAEFLPLHNHISCCFLINSRPFQVMPRSVVFLESRFTLFGHIPMLTSLIDLIKFKCNTPKLAAHMFVMMLSKWHTYWSITLATFRSGTQWRNQINTTNWFLQIRLWCLGIEGGSHLLCPIDLVQLKLHIVSTISEAREGGFDSKLPEKMEEQMRTYCIYIYIYVCVCNMYVYIYIYPSCFGYTVTLLSDLPWYPELQFLYSLIEHPPLSLFEFQLIFMKSIVFWLNPHWCWWKHAFSSASSRKISGFHPTMLVSSPAFPSFAKSPCVPAPPSRMPLQWLWVESRSWKHWEPSAS